MSRVILWSSVVIAAVGMSARGAESGQCGAEKLGWKLALQTWTVRGQTVPEAIDTAHEIGVHYLEIYPGEPLVAGDKKATFNPGMSDQQIEEVLAKAKSADVQIISFGVFRIPSKEAEARKVFDWAKKIGLLRIVSEPAPESLPMIDKLAGEYGIPVAIHNHPKPTGNWNPQHVFELVKDLKNVGFCADVGHWKRSELDPVAVLKQYGDKVLSVHFKDLAPGGSRPQQHGLHDVPWGTGESHAAEMLEVLKEKGFKGPIAIEYESDWSVPVLRKCVEFFNQQADKLAQ